MKKEKRKKYEKEYLTLQEKIRKKIVKFRAKKDIDFLHDDLQNLSTGNAWYIKKCIKNLHESVCPHFVISEHGRLCKDFTICLSQSPLSLPRS